MKATRLVLAIAVAIACGAEAQVLSRGPYLQMGTPDSMVVVWRTLQPSDGRVVYGTAPGQLTRSVPSARTSTQHEVRITGLQPKTRYFYAVESGGRRLAGGDEAHFFVTAPPRGERHPFRMWVVGDSGTGNLNQMAVRDAMLRATAASGRPDLILHMGDMAYSDGTDLEFQLRFFVPYQEILRNTVVWPTMGNHEGHTSDSATESGPYYDAYVLPQRAEAGGLASGTEAYYSFDYANVHFVVLDSHESPREPDGAMLRWMRDDLAATRQEWIIAYWHHPPYSKGSHDSDVEAQLIDMRENALPILEAAGVDLVLAGHSHIYERSYLVNGAYDTPTTAEGKILDPGDGRLDGTGPYRKRPGINAREGTVYVVAGHGGASLRQTGTHPLMYLTERRYGSCLIDVDGNTLHLRNIRSDGVVSDHFTLVKDAPVADGGVGVADGGGAGPDGGGAEPDGGGAAPPAGCGCAGTGTPASSLGLLLLAALALLARRARR